VSCVDELVREPYTWIERIVEARGRAVAQLGLEEEEPMLEDSEEDDLQSLHAGEFFGIFWFVFVVVVSAALSLVSRSVLSNLRPQN